MIGNEAATPLAPGPSVAAADVSPTTSAVVTAMRNGGSHQATRLAEMANCRCGSSQSTNVSAEVAAAINSTLGRSAATRRIAEAA